MVWGNWSITNFLYRSRRGHTQQVLTTEIEVFGDGVAINFKFKFQIAASRQRTHGKRNLKAVALIHNLGPRSIQLFSQPGIAFETEAGQVTRRIDSYLEAAFERFSLRRNIRTLHQPDLDGRGHISKS